MLQKALRQDNGADGQVQKAAGHPGVENQIRTVTVDAQLGGHGGVDLADAAAAGDDVLVNGIEGDAGHGLHGLRPAGEDTLDLAGHGVGKGDFHRLLLLTKFAEHIVQSIPHPVPPVKGGAGKSWPPWPRGKIILQNH